MRRNPFRARSEREVHRLDSYRGAVGSGANAGIALRTRLESVLQSLHVPNGPRVVEPFANFPRGDLHDVRMSRIDEHVAFLGHEDRRHPQQQAGI